MKNLKVSHIIIIFIMTISFFCQGKKVYAKEEDKLGYVVSVVHPSTQIDPSKGYFYIETKPGIEQELEVKVKSTKKEPVTIKIGATNAITGNHGTIDYSNDPSLMDCTLKNSIMSMVKIKTETVTVANFEEKKVCFSLLPPKEKYEGVKMGALVFTVDTESKNKGVSTEFSYKLGIITSESGDYFNNGETLVLENVKASLNRGKKMVLATLQNPEPQTIENLKMDVTMKKQGSEKIIKHKKVENYRMAPNSHFDFEIDWGIEDVPAGKYVLDIVASNDLHEWKLSKSFSITNQQAEKINKESAIQIITPIWIKGITVTLMFIELGLIVYIIFRRIKWEKELQMLNKHV